MPDSDLAQVHAQGAAYRRWQHSAGYRQRRLVADTWCAAFVWLSLAEVEAVNPNSKALPIPRSRRDAAFTLEIHRRIPVLWDEHDANGNPWGITANNLFNMTDDSDLFQTREDLEGAGWRLDGNVFVKDGKRMLPLYEAKMAHHFDHRYNSFYDTGKDDRRRLSDEEKSMATTQAEPRYWIARDGLIPTIRRRKEVEVPGVEARLAELEWDRGWLCGWREVCRSTDERTAIPAFIPRTAAGHTFPRMLPRVPALQVAALIATQSSLVFDYVSRQKVGGIHMNLSVWKVHPGHTRDRDWQPQAQRDREVWETKRARKK